MAAYVLDSSAVMSVLFDEVGAFKVLELLDEASRGNSQISLRFMALMEIEYWLLRRLPKEAERSLLLVQSWPVEVEESYPELKAGFPLSVADAWIAALAIIQDAELVHKDPQFERIRDLKTLRLPYKG
ncbi:PIN domain-containing protein [Dehalococcoidales bacterium]|nr:PIN domain-containing protein [Dehalococcoidales bacterium]MCL0091632.1 PIN domain-containing protein [Dehalococcoidales bacterium]